MKPYDAYFHNVGDGTSRLTLREAGDMDWELYDDHTSLEGPYHIPSLRRDRQQYVKWYVVCDPDHPDRIDSDYHLLRTVNAVQQGHDGGTLNICEDQLLLPPILYDHLTEALGDFIPTVTTDDLRRYEEWGRP
ncbi:Vps4 C terminal oligomerisation domain containing protein, putative [Angomonas deanei]|uniref:Vps4 C terminal oligomerisation domain containing protein, putative n=1 Tax=Angomonas deanei TaxID=59799 RepID=A0A7G2C4Y1_9TRYP|nr:Vps4 C terminal oligomerisation domain containing protein, putative [Angomonas deanei]